MPSNHLILCQPLLLLISIFLRIQVYSNESVLTIRWPKWWSFRFSFITSTCNHYSGLISFRMDRVDLPAIQGTLKNLLQHHSSKALILQCSAFFIVQLSHPYMTTGKTIALTRRTFVGKVMSLLLNMLSRLVLTFLPSSFSLLAAVSSNLSCKIPSGSLLQVRHKRERLFRVKWKSLSRVWLFVTPWTIQCMEFSRSEYWSG